LYPYTQSLGVYKCPGDKRDFRIDWNTQAVSPAPPYLRSFSIPQYMGEIDVDWNARQLTDIRWAEQSRSEVLLGRSE